ncbi:hypothetical protein A5630_20765 [Mycolicibacterium mucogenicum]|uniref:Uncharacterized protein n=2 Tax=Mycolicibacterium mucogenicum TaxID=56689 RepID=A0A1A3H4I4_MYCMU|nr:hypothetical protein A5630_20765 [Mycolicibacterium mucogenicum]
MEDMSILDMVKVGDPSDVARVGVAIAESIVAKGTARANVIAAAHQLLDLGLLEIADRLAVQQSGVDELHGPADPSARRTSSRQTALQDRLPSARHIDLSGVCLDGVDLVLTVTSHGIRPQDVEVDANGTTLEFKLAGTDWGAAKTINVYRRIANDDLSWQLSGDELTVRVREYVDRPLVRSPDSLLPRPAPALAGHTDHQQISQDVRNPTAAGSEDIGIESEST